VENILKIAKEIEEFCNKFKNLEEQIFDLQTKNTSLQIECFNKNKIINEKEQLIDSLRSNIKGLGKTVARLEKSPEVKEVKSTENKFKEDIMGLKKEIEELIIKNTRLKRRNYKLSTKNIVQQKRIDKLVKLIKEL